MGNMQEAIGKGQRGRGKGQWARGERREGYLVNFWMEKWLFLI
jgi:hypothetical protein